VISRALGLDPLDLFREIAKAVESSLPQPPPATVE
jgi:hypothetical protein